MTGTATLAVDSLPPVLERIPHRFRSPGFAQFPLDADRWPEVWYRFALEADRTRSYDVVVESGKARLEPAENMQVVERTSSRVAGPPASCRERAIPVHGEDMCMVTHSRYESEAFCDRMQASEGEDAYERAFGAWQPFGSAKEQHAWR